MPCLSTPLISRSTETSPRTTTRIPMQDDGVPIFEKLEAERGGPLPVLTPAVRDALLKNIKRRMTPQPIKVGGAQGGALMLASGWWLVAAACRDWNGQSMQWQLCAFNVECSGLDAYMLL